MSFPGSMTPGQALGGGLTLADPATGQPAGQDPNLIDPTTGLPYTQAQPAQQGTASPQPPVSLFGGMTPGQAMGGGFSFQQPQPQPLQQPQQQFPNLNKNPAFNPMIQAPQQMQQIAQGQPTLVNQLAPPPAAGTVPGQTITQVPPPFPSALPSAQPAPQPMMPPVAQAQPQQLIPPPPVQPMPTQATQGYQSRIQPRPPLLQIRRPGAPTVSPAPKPAPRPPPQFQIRRPGAPTLRPVPVRTR